MKLIHTLPILFLLLFACSDQNTGSEKAQDPKPGGNIVVASLQTLMDSSDLRGAILLYDLEADTYYSNDFGESKKGQLPASTFKITNSMIALETAVVENDSSLFRWNGEDRMLDVWEQDLTLKEAFHYSCVPCYQEIARKIGVENMNRYLDTLNYGTMDVDSTNIDRFWLQGESCITPFEQIDFLKRFYESTLPISSRTETIMKRMMIMEENDAYTMSGKTGWSIQKGVNNGWFVGYVETNNKTYFFATNIEPNHQFDRDAFVRLRKEVTFKALKQMKII